MDPTACLDRIYEAISGFTTAEARGIDPRDAGGELVDAFWDLDRWLRRGGFLPAQWQSKREQRYFVAPDGDDIPTIWIHTDALHRPKAVLRITTLTPEIRGSAWEVLTRGLATRTEVTS